ncbi:MULTISPECIES: pyrophosphatase PpaX [unclassified Virgibacillus]|uniref:pyrophosphatase PpaX n=1 Tax=unclassified Virgibacillus TaxID=2620237 RepID=UPI00090C8D73|nr:MULTISPECIES: pyrophosphatase PpaX [unclassified Virgibacillus]API93470.1 pyrophosphatase PpaX [Virgibacillus sp. 6R]MBS7430145.1 pyrophosphatase PpaX [Virgibacillus sp. 19R1-5]
MSIRTILFDLDGTLIDTNELIIASFFHTFGQYNYQFTREEIIEFNGPPLLDTFKAIDAEKAERMVQTYRAHNMKEHDNYVKAFPFVEETLKQLKQNGMKLGVVTTKMRQGVKKGLATTDLEPYFDTVITLDDVKHPKPHAEPVMKAMDKLAADAATTLMVGDNSHDLEAGKNAGVQTAGVAWSFKGKERLMQYKPTYMLEDMRDLLTITGV